MEWLVQEVFMDSGLKESMKTELQGQLPSIISSASRTRSRTRTVYASLPNEVNAASWEKKQLQEKHRQQEQEIFHSHQDLHSHDESPNPLSDELPEDHRGIIWRTRARDAAARLILDRVGRHIAGDPGACGTTQFADQQHT